MVKAFTHSHPNIRLGVYENTDMVERLADGELDLVLTRALERSPRIEYENFYVERTVLTIGKGLADKLCLDPAEITVSLERDHLNALRECPFIFHQPHGDTQSIFLQMASHSDFTPRCCCEIFGTSTILKLTLDNIGASFNPASMVNNFLTPEEQKQLYIFPLPEKYNYLIQFAYRRQRYQWSIIQDFMCTARNLFPISESFCLRI
jgi:DNA-binding transcriptional LysR family regulator